MSAAESQSWTIGVGSAERCSISSPTRCGRKRTTTRGQPVMLLRGFAKGVPTKHLTDEMDLAYPSVLKRRHRIQESSDEGEQIGLPGEAPEEGLPDPEVESDEMYQNAGKKVIRTWIQMILLAEGLTSREDEGPTRTTGLPSWHG